MAEVADDIQTQLDKDPNFQYNTLKMGSNGRPDFNQLLGLQTTDADNSPSKTNTFYNHAFGLQQAKQTAKDKAEAQLNDWWLLNLYNISDNQLSAHISALEFAKRPLETNEPKAANEPADVNGQVTAGATAGGLSTVVSSTTQAEETTETQITADAPTLQEGGNEEYLKLWTDAKANANLDAEAKAFLKTVDPSIFTQELSEDTLENNKGFLSAAKILYNDENSDKSSGELSWDEHIAKKAAEEGWGEGLPEDEKAAIIAQRAEEELGEWAIDHMANINYQTWEGGKTAIGFKEKSVSVQLATLYMMQAYEHKDATLSSSGRAVWKTVSDPVNLALMGGGALFAFFTGGTSIAGASALIAARQALVTNGRMAAIKAIQNTVMNNGLKSALTVGALEGAAEGLAQDYFIQHTLEESGYNALKLDHEYSLSRGATTVLTSAVIGGALNELGVTAGTAFKKTKPDAPTPTTTDAANEAIEETAEEVIENTAEKAAKDTVEETLEETAEKAAKETAEETLEETAEKAAKETADTTPAPTTQTPAANQPEAPNAFNNAANNTGSRNSSNSITLEDGQDLDDWLVENNAEDWFFGLKKSQQKFIRARAENGKSFNGPSAQQTQAAPAPTAAAPTTPTPQQPTPQQPTPQQPTPQQPAPQQPAPQQPAPQQPAPQQPTTPTTEASAAPTEASTTQTTEASATPTGAGVETPTSTTSTAAEAGTAPTNTENMLPHPRRSWMHYATSGWNPYVFIGRQFPKVATPADALPLELSFDKYIIPITNAVDKALIGEGANANQLAQSFSNLSKELERIASQINSGANPIDPQDAKQLAEKAILDFRNNNQQLLDDTLKNLGTISEEIKLEKKLSEYSKKKPPSAHLDDIKAAISDYEQATGRIFHGKEERIQAVLDGYKRTFHLTDRQGRAALEYVNAIQKSLNNVNSDKFLNDYLDNIDQAYNTGADERIHQAFTHSFNFITSESAVAAKRQDPANEGYYNNIWELNSLDRGRTADSLIVLNARRTGLREGYFNPYEFKVIPNTAKNEANTEAIIMDIEDMDLNSTDTSSLIGMVKTAYNRGDDLQIIEAIRRLNMKAGKEKNHKLLDAFLNEFTRGPDFTNNTEHFKYFARTLSEVASVGNSPYKWHERDVQQIYQGLTYKSHHARKYVSPGNAVSTPGRMFFLENPTVYTVRGTFAHLLGGKYTTEKGPDNEVISQYNIWKPTPEDTKGFFATAAFHAKDKLVMQPLRMGKNLALLPIRPGWEASKFLYRNEVFRNVLLYPAGAGVALAGVEGTAEYYLPENTWVTDEEGNLIIPEIIPGIGGADLDIGSRLIGGSLHLVDGALAPIRWNISGVNAIAEHAFDINSPINPDWVSVGDDALIPLTRWNAQLTGDRYEGLTATEAAEILSDFRDHNGYNPYDDIEPAKRRALIAQMVEDNQADPSGYDIQTLKVELTEEEKKKAKEEADAKAKADAEANGASTSPSTSTSGDAESTDTTPESNSSPTLADAQNVASGAWDSVGNIFNAGANGALGSFDWMLTGKDAIGGGHLAADFKNAGSGFFNWVGDTWSDLANNRIKGGQKWLSFGLALLAAFPVMGFASQKLGALNIGGIPALIIGALTVGFGGGLINKLFKGQGNGSHVTTDVKQNTEQSVDHSGKDNTPDKPPKPVPARVDDFSFKIKGKDAVLSDEDEAKTKGQDTLTYAVVQGGGKTNHVALSIVSNKDDAKKIVEQGQCTYVPFNLNPARGQTFDTTIEGVNHAGNEGKFAVFQGQDASNDPNAVCFELKAG